MVGPCPCSGTWGRRRHSARPPVPRQQYQNGESEESHAQFLKALQNAVTTFVNRMKSNHVRGRSITNDSAVLSLFQSINGMHPQLLELLNQLDERRRRCRTHPPGRPSGATGAPVRGRPHPLGAVGALHQASSGLGSCGQGCPEGPWVLQEIVPVAGNVPLSAGQSAGGSVCVRACLPTHPGALMPAVPC